VDAPPEPVQRGLTRSLTGPQAVAQVAGGAVAMLGVLVLVGWVFDATVLTSVAPGWVSMKANTAIGFVLAGVALSALRFEDGPRSLRLIGLGCASGTALIGLATLAEYALGWDLGIDQVLFSEPADAVRTLSPGRMSPTTAICFTLVGLALVLLDVATRGGRWPAQWFVASAGVLSMFEFVGYVYGVPSSEGVGRYSAMPAHTAAGFLVLCGGVFAARPRRGIAALILDRHAGGSVARRLLPWGLGAPLVLGWLRLMGERAGLFDLTFGVAAMTVVTFVCFSAAILGLAGPLNRTDTARRQAENATRELNTQLERRVEERTAELSHARAALENANRALHAQNAALGRANEELQRFAYVASHDLQEPLRKIVSFSRLLVERFPGDIDPDARMYLDRVTGSAGRMQRLIDDLLMFSRAGRPVDVGPVDCTTALRSALDSLSVPIADTDASVTFDHLPPVIANTTHIEQLFQNLIGNALKYRGDAPPRIHVGVEERDGEWRFTVSDNGIGFDMDYADRIFQVFQRLHARGQYGGTGIGLALCKRIVESYGGRIGVTSQPGNGSTFWFTLPAAGSAQRREVSNAALR
jgi:signal transduction histidine kinase